MQTLAIEIHETARLLRRDFDRRASVLGATSAQWRVLARLARFGNGARQIELADALDVEPITLCRMIDRLEAAGLVERRRDESDRRAWQIYMTAKAEPVIADLQRLREAFNADVLDGIDPNDIATVHAVMARIRENLTATNVRKTA